MLACRANSINKATRALKKQCWGGEVWKDSSNYKQLGDATT